MPTSEQDYLRRRARQHATCATQASCNEAMIIHRKLEAEYRRLLQKLIPCDTRRQSEKAASQADREDALGPWTRDNANSEFADAS